MGSCLRKDALFKTNIDKINTLLKTKIPKNIPWLAARPHYALIREYPPPPGLQLLGTPGVDQDIFYRGGQGKESQLSSKEYCIKAYILRHTVFIRLTARGAY